MAYGSGRAFASVFRAIGVDADIVPPSDDRTRELGSRYTSGDECYPAKVTVGDFMKLLEQPDVDPEKVLLFMPTADGPCRFGQYAPYLKQVLVANGYEQTEIISPTSNNSYQGLCEMTGPFVRNGREVADDSFGSVAGVPREPGALPRPFSCCADSPRRVDASDLDTKSRTFTKCWSWPCRICQGMGPWAK